MEKVQHKKIADFICRKFDLKYKRKGGVFEYYDSKNTNIGRVSILLINSARNKKEIFIDMTSEFNKYIKDIYMENIKCNSFKITLF